MVVDPPTSGCSWAALLLAAPAACDGRLRLLPRRRPRPTAPIETHTWLRRPQLPKGKGTISNEAAVAPSLAALRTGVHAGGVAAQLGGEELRVVPLGKHKKAWNYAGKNW